MAIKDTIYEFFGKDNEFIASFDLAIKERITSPFYGYFIVSWLIINWKILYVALFVSQDNMFEKTGLLRHEYLSNFFPTYATWQHWWSFLFFPLLITIFFFWISPFVTRPFYRKNLKNQKKLLIIQLQETTEQKKEEKKLVKEETELIKEKAEKAKQVKKVEKESPEVLWQQEFEEFTKNPLFWDLNNIKKIIYSNGGKIYKKNPYGEMSRMISPDTLALFHLKNIVNLRGQGEDEILELTEKGKFFMIKSLNDKP